MKGNFVLDAKYKHLEGSMNRDDLHQLITYMHILPSENGAFIYPLDKDLKENLSKPREIKGYGGSVWTIGVKIPQDCNSLKVFAGKMKDSELNVKKILGNELCMKYYPG